MFIISQTNFNLHLICQQQVTDQAEPKDPVSPVSLKVPESLNLSRPIPDKLLFDGLEVEKTQLVDSFGDVPKLKFSKEDFKEMKICGQFNRGFIITLLPTSRDSQLFIIDQHASDEKSRFEHLMETSKIGSQRLWSPLPFEASPSEVEFIKGNLKIFLANGFEFDEECKFLKAVGTFEGKQMTPLDCRELLEEIMAVDSDFHSGQSSVLKCPKISRTHASRSCRLC
eukprot:GHVP01000732.1.p1 GENE.GHVP01000732.1~~GHVP01000732.1.p1  ORF type:complete len:226 (-),score=44.31 GHVP01000732.1:136-813(-)